MPLGSCVSCGSDETKLIKVRDNLKYMSCATCGHCNKLYNNNVNSECFEEAQAKYFGESSQLLRIRKSPLENEVLNMRVGVVEKWVSVPSTVLEVGPGAGSFLAWLASAGHQVTAVEHSSALASDLSKRLSLSILSGEFEDCEIEPESMDAFCSFHVIEHVRNPKTHMQRSFDAVRPGGFAFIATPNGMSWQQKLFKTLSPNFDSAHLRVFSPESLRRTCEEAGWSVVAVYTPEYTSDWMRVFTKLLRRIKREDEEATAGKYAGSISPTFLAATWVARVVSYPFRVLQAHLRGGNELFFVLEKRM